MTRFLLTIAYDGTAYCGWQVQKNGLSIQTLVQQALETALRCPIDLTGAGRTDAGVHAYGQRAHFDVEAVVVPLKLFASLNALLPPDIRILSIDPVRPDFHARYCAVRKVYHYHLGWVLSPFTAPYRWHLFRPLSLERLQEGTKLFLGTRDFTSFANEAHRGSAAKDPVRTLFRFDALPEPGGVRLELEADGFLYKMVRNLVGTLVDVVDGRTEAAEVEAMFAARDRRRAGTSAPPQGLFLKRVEYESVK